MEDALITEDEVVVGLMDQEMQQVLRVSDVIKTDMLHTIARTVCLNYKQHKRTKTMRRRRQMS